MGAGLVVECHVDGPFFPYFAYEAGAGIENLLAGFPAGRRGLGAFAFANELESLDLTQGLADVAAHGRGQDFEALNDAVGVDEEAATDVNACGFIIHAVNFADIAAAVGQHGEGHLALGDHFAQFMILPHFVDEHGVGGHGENLYAELFKFFVLLCDRRDFSCSDKGEITRIETKSYPLTEVFGQLD